ncbi:MAG: RIP metalloprotease RseP [Muribaculaceae bacterium]|nr:RIP metalloprotease RseP [Muribaculaceae bacterium]
METFLIKAAQLILAFAILVIIHEFGHFLFARLFGVRVEKFYIFFDPWTELFKWRPKKYIGGLGKTKEIKSSEEPKEKSFWGNTEYGIGWLPLGGYCKISGMIDESMDTEQMKQPAQEWEFRSKPAWQRLLIMVAGVLFNFLLAIIIYAGIVYATGEKYVPFNEAKMGMQYSGEARKIGFHNGDIPLMADGKVLDNPAEARMEMIQAKEVKVLRNGKDTVNITIPSDFLITMDKEAKSDTAQVSFMNYRIPVGITQVTPGEGAAKADIKTGDRIIAIDSVPTPSLYEFFETLPGHDNRTVAMTVVRKSGESNDTIIKKVTLSANSKMGVGLEVDPSAFFNYEEKHYGLFESVPRGVTMGTDRLVSYAKSMKMVFTKEGANSIGGFGSIGSIFPESWDWIAFWNIAAFLSVALAFMNILPIPALDGGHVMFLLYEVIFRRKPSEKFMERAQIVGMTLLILLLIYANGMDIIRLFK